MNTGFKHQPQWFTGVVEDINDPSEMGRIKVRCFGYHTPIKELDQGGIPTENLPWSHVMMPVNSASMSGIGQSATGILQGSWVIGFFRDGQALQDPFVIGTLPSMSSTPPAINSGFNDPDGIYPLTDRLEESDLSPASRKAYIDTPPYITKEENRQEGVNTAIPPSATSVVPDKSNLEYERQTWDNLVLEDYIVPAYPQNHVYESESGHILEVDDTLDYERLSRFHKSGTYEEIVATGDRTITVVGDEYSVTFKNKNMVVRGDVNMTVDGNMRTLVKGNYHLEVDGDKTENVKGDRITRIDSNEYIQIASNFKSHITGNHNTHVSGTTAEHTNGTVSVSANGNISITGPMIHLN